MKCNPNVAVLCDECGRRRAQHTPIETSTTTTTKYRTTHDNSVCALAIFSPEFQLCKMCAVYQLTLCICESQETKECGWFTSCFFCFIFLFCSVLCFVNVYLRWNRTFIPTEISPVYFKGRVEGFSCLTIDLSKGNTGGWVVSIVR